MLHSQLLIVPSPLTDEDELVGVPERFRQSDFESALSRSFRAYQNGVLSSIGFPFSSVAGGNGLELFCPAASTVPSTL